MNAEIIEFADAAQSLSREIPEDLYIPPGAMEVITQGFEGPLDLLLYFIRKNKFNILDLPVAEIAAQYSLYINMMKKIHMDLAGEYLAMAATLTHIKSRMLLPPKQSEDEEDEDVDPRAELARRLQEYEQFKIAAESLNLRSRVGREIFVASIDSGIQEAVPELPHIDLEELVALFTEVTKLAAQDNALLVGREQYSVKDRVNLILDKLRKKDHLEFNELYDQKEGVAGVVVAFLATLELINSDVVNAIQADPKAPIHIQLR